MAEVEFAGEDDLETLGDLQDINVKRALVNVEKKRREHLEVLSIDLTNEPRGMGDDDAKGVFCDLLIRVTDGPNADYEYKERVYCDTRIKKGAKNSAFKSMFLPFVIGVALAAKGKTASESYFTGCARSKETMLEDYVARATTLCGQRFTAELGVERGGQMQDEKGNKIPDKFFDDKQRIFGFVPAN